MLINHYVNCYVDVVQWFLRKIKQDKLVDPGLPVQPLTRVVEARDNFNFIFYTISIETFCNQKTLDETCPCKILIEI